jgi:hypothetical protein
MSKGILLFAHNNEQIDYGKMAYITAKFAKKNLDVPVSLVTDTGTIAWMKENDNLIIEDVFDKVIITDDYVKDLKQIRRYYDGSLEYKKADFKNCFRAWAFEYTPYEQTLVIDVDFLIVNDRLNNVWDSESDFMINKTSYDLANTRDPFEFKRVSDHGIDFFWATAFYFRKNLWTKTFFGLCQHIVENYDYYRFVYRIDAPLLRNDYIFSIAIHIMGGFSNKINPPPLPCEIYYTLDRDELIRVDSSKSFLFLVQKKGHSGEYTLAKTNNQNVHIMNKFSINRHEKELLEVING